MPKDIWNLMHFFSSLRGSIGTIPCLIAFGLYFKIKNPEFMDLARAYLSILDHERLAPDWIRALANGNNMDVIEAARIDMMAGPEFNDLREEEENERSN